MNLGHPSALVISLALGLQLASGISTEDSGSGWEPGDTVDGDGFSYQLFSKEQEGEPFTRFKVRGTIDAPPPALVRAFLESVTDPARAPDGQTRRVISKDERSFIVYTSMDLPPLFSDRDIILLGESSVDSATGINRVAWKAIDHPAAPRIEGTIRIERAAGSWVFAPADDGKSDVTYENYLDLRGSLPHWLLQGLMAGTVGKSFEDIAAGARGKLPTATRAPRSR